MIKKVGIVIVVILFFIFSGAMIHGGGESYQSSKKVVSIQTPIVADFEDASVNAKWTFIATSPNFDKDASAIQTTVAGPWGLAVPDDKKKNCLGVKTAFKTRGYNFIELAPPVYDVKLYPGTEDYFKPAIPNPNNERFIPLPGKVQSIDVWVAGRNFRYTLEVHLKDFNGFVYRLRMGKIDYQGWRNLSKPLPFYVPQEEKYLPKEKPLKFMKYVLIADPDERADRLYVYFDHMKVITDLYIEKFDGIEMKDAW